MTQSRDDIEAVLRNIEARWHSLESVSIERSDYGDEIWLGGPGCGMWTIETKVGDHEDFIDAYLPGGGSCEWEGPAAAKTEAVQRSVAAHERVAKAMHTAPDDIAALIEVIRALLGDGA